VLESIFSFAGLIDIAALLAVCRDWHGAVLRMKPLALTLVHSTAFVKSGCMSRVRRHFYRLKDVSSSKWTTMSLVARQMPHLLELGVLFKLDLAAELPPAGIFSAALRSLSFGICPQQGEDGDKIVLPEGSEARVTAHFNAVMDIIGQLPILKELRLEVHWQWHSLVSLNALLDALSHRPSLRKLDLETFGKLSDEEIEKLRQLSQLEVLTLPPGGYLGQLLAPGHALRLSEMSGIVIFSQETLDALASMPSLTDIEISYASRISNIDFLRALRRLSSLRLYIDVNIDPTTALAALRTCARMTRLHIDKHDLLFTSEQWSALLQHIPLLADLSIAESKLLSLDFLTSGSITRTLTSLYLVDLFPVCRWRSCRNCMRYARCSLSAWSTYSIASWIRHRRRCTNHPLACCHHCVSFVAASATLKIAKITTC